MSKLPPFSVLPRLALNLTQPWRIQPAAPLHPPPSCPDPGPALPRLRESGKSSGSEVGVFLGGRAAKIPFTAMCKGDPLAQKSFSSPLSFVHLDTLNSKPLPLRSFVSYSEPELAESPCPGPEDNLGTNLEGGLRLSQRSRSAVAFLNPLMPSHLGRVSRPHSPTALPRRLPGRLGPTAPGEQWEARRCPAAGTPCPAVAAPFGRLSCGGVILSL